jgi:hypothetical protein
MEFLSDRISLVKNDENTSIVISSVADRKKSRTVAIILFLWLVGGIAMIWGFPSIQEDKTKIIVIIWFAFWIYFLYVLFRLWRWKKAGHEVIKISNGVLKYKKDVKGRGWVLDFALDKIQKLRVSDTESPGWLKNLGGDFWNTDCDSLRFDCEHREFSFGFQLSSAERQKLLKLLGEFVAAEEVLSKRKAKESEWKKETE